MAKPVGAACNLACHYCYYHKPQHGVMDMHTLEQYIQQYIAMQTTGHVLFTWHGGEPMLRPLSFYRKALELQHKYADGRVVENCIQTNGTLLTPEWCQFLHDNHWLVGISIDGTQDMHDAFRVKSHESRVESQEVKTLPLNKGESPKGEGVCGESRAGNQEEIDCPPARGGLPEGLRGGSRLEGACDTGSWHKVMQGIHMLDRYGVEWNAMATVHAANVLRPLDFYHFFNGIGCHYLQFTPIVESDGHHVLPMAVKPDEWGNFLCAIFDEWVRHDVGQTFVQIFDATLANWLGVTPGLCTLAAECGHAGVIEANGDVYSCDHFVFPEHRLGNIHSDTLINMMYGEQQSRFSAKKTLELPDQCRQCRWIFACHGECPKNRIKVKSHNTQCSMLNVQCPPYLCSGYRHFFSHVAPKMDIMAALYRQGKAPAEIMIL